MFYFVMLLLYTIGLEATLKDPISAESRVVVIKSFNNEYIVLPYARCYAEEDFSRDVHELYTIVKQRVATFNASSQSTPPHCINNRSEKRSARLNKNFLIHHGNLLIHAVHQKSPDLFKELLNIDSLKNRFLFWQEDKTKNKHMGTIHNYVQICLEQNPDIPELQEFWNFLNNQHQAAPSAD